MATLEIELLSTVQGSALARGVTWTSDSEHLRKSF